MPEQNRALRTEEVKMKAAAEEVKMKAAAEEVKMKAAAEEVKMKAAAEEVKMKAAAEEVKMKAAAEEVKMKAAAEEVKMKAAAEEVKMKAAAEEVKMKAAAEPTQAESEPEFNALQLWARDEERAEVTETTAKINSDSEPDQDEDSEKQLLSFKTSNLETEIQEKVSPGSHTDQSPETLSGSASEDSTNPQSDSAQTFTEDIIPNPESSLRPKAERGEHLESDPGLRTEVKTAGANQPLR